MQKSIVYRFANYAALIGKYQVNLKLPKILLTNKEQPDFNSSFDQVHLIDYKTNAKNGNV
jgi:hypothetical protein